MYKIQLVYEDNGKKYIFSFDEVVNKLLTEEQIDTIKKRIIKEIQKL